MRNKITQCGHKIRNSFNQKTVHTKRSNDEKNVVRWTSCHTRVNIHKEKVSTNTRMFTNL